jgi:hypothetical protein
MVRIQNKDVPKWIFTLMNNLYEIERKLAVHGDVGNATRNVERIKEALFDDGQGVFYEDPLGQPFNETRADLDADIAGPSAENLFVAEVIKPIIRSGTVEFSRVIQKGIVVVQGRQKEKSQ